MTKYMVWAKLPHNLRRAFIDAATAADARKRYADAYGIPVEDCKSQKLEG